MRWWSLIMITDDYHWWWSLMMISDDDLWWWSLMIKVMITDLWLSLIFDYHWSMMVMITNHCWWSLITDDDQFYLSVMISGNRLCCCCFQVIINAIFFLCSCFFINHHSHDCSFSDDQQCGRTWSKSVWTTSLFTLSVRKSVPASMDCPGRAVWNKNAVLYSCIIVGSPGLSVIPPPLLDHWAAV